MAGFSIDGIMSGLDTASIIDAIMEYERRPAVLLEIDQAEKTNIVTTLKALQAKVFAVQAQAQALTRKATFEQASVTVSEEGYLNATASSRVAVGSYDLQVLSVARNHQIASQGFSDEELNSFGTGSIQIGVGTGSPQTITIDASNNNLTAIKDAINEAKVGVTASIINDGSDSSSYRMILTANSTGLSNSISITSNLTGGPNLNYSTASFDGPEMLVTDSGSSSQISLAAAASFAGTSNKNYTFTVQGTGSQIIGTDNITIDWTDGINSGSIIVTQGDTDFELVGDGAEGLSLSFSAGELTGGDVFQVQTFAPLLQEASDAVIALGSTGGTGSPIQIVSDSNRFTDVIAGVVLDVEKETAPGEHLTITTDINIDAVKKSIQGFIDAFNDVNKFIDKQNSYDPETDERGLLLGDSIVQSVQYQLRGVLSSMVNAEAENYRYLSSIGIRTGYDGQLKIADSSRFEAALREDLDDVIALFTDTGFTEATGIEFMSASTDTVDGRDYLVDVTRAATQGSYVGTNITDPAVTPLLLDATNNRLKFRINGKSSDDIVLAAKSYDTVAELVNEIQLRIDSDLKVGNQGTLVSWEETATGSGHLVLTNSLYGSSSTISMDTSIDSNASTLVGLSAGVATNGLDVQGTINGEEAVGKGQILTGAAENETTAGLKLKITLTDGQISSGTEGSITLAKGIGSRLNKLLTSLSASGDGVLDRRIKSYEDQASYLGDRVTEFDARMALRRERLETEFREMEAALAKIGAMGDYLSAQVSSLNANWSQIARNG